MHDLSTCALRWLPRAIEAAEQLGISTADAEAIARNPRVVTPDPGNPYREWQAERRRAGDVTVVVALPPDRDPVIWGVYLHLPLDPVRQHGAGGGNVRQIPKTMRELRKRIAENPRLKIKPGGHHDKVVDLDNRVLTTLPSTPSDYRAVANAAASIARKGYEL